MIMAFEILIGYQQEWEEVLLIFHQCLFHSNSRLIEYPIPSCRLSSMIQMKWQLWQMSKGQSSILTKLLFLMLFQSLSPIIKDIFSLFMLLVVMGRHFCVTLLLLRLEEEVRQHYVQHYLGLLLFCWIEEEYLTHTSRFLFLSMKTLWLDSNTIVTCSQSSNKPRLSFGMKFLCSTSMILMLLINVSETCLK